MTNLSGASNPNVPLISTMPVAVVPHFRQVCSTTLGFVSSTGSEIGSEIGSGIGRSTVAVCHLSYVSGVMSGDFFVSSGNNSRSKLEGNRCQKGSKVCQPKGIAPRK